MNLFSNDVSFLWPALLAGVLVAISHVPLGQQVLARGIVFIDLAIAQVAGLGVIAAAHFDLPVTGWGAQLLLLANDPHGGENLKDLLAGQILWVSTGQLVRTAILTAAFALVWFTWREKLGRIGFYVLFALVVTASVQLVGVYLVFTTLIVPAVATYRHLKGRQLMYGYALAVGSY